VALPSFRLQSVLDYRRSLVDTARMELASLEVRCGEEEERLTELRVGERNVISQIHEKQRVIVSLPDVMRLNEHLNVLGRRISNQWSALQRIRSEIARTRIRLLELTKDMKAMEKLQERQAEEAAWDTMRQERIETSEVAARHYLTAVAR